MAAWAQPTSHGRPSNADRGARRTSCSPPPTRWTSDDLERLAITAHLLGRDEASAEAWERAHLACARAPATTTGRPAARSGWPSRSLLRGEMARGGGWLARAERLVEDAEPACASRGFLLVADFLEALEGGDADDGARPGRPRSSTSLAGVVIATSSRSACSAAARRRSRSARSAAGCGCSTR